MSCSRLRVLCIWHTKRQPQPAATILRPLGMGIRYRGRPVGRSCKDPHEKYDKTLLNHLKILQLTFAFLHSLNEGISPFRFCFPVNPVSLAKTLRQTPPPALISVFWPWSTAALKDSPPYQGINIYKRPASPPARLTLRNFRCKLNPYAEQNVLKFLCRAGGNFCARHVHEN